MESVTGGAASLPDIQFEHRPGIIDFAWGHPASDLLPVDDVRRAAVDALGRDGVMALAYGYAQGPGRLIEAVRVRLGRIEGRVPSAEQVLITGGASQGLDLVCALVTQPGGASHGLDLVCALVTQPGDVVLVESPVYHIALRMLRDRGLGLVAVPSDDDGLRVDAVEETLDRLRREGRRARLLYTVPTFTNPTGVTLTAERRAELARLAARHDLLVVEDDVYRELWFKAPPPPSIAHYDASAPVVRLGSFAKILAPGLRLGWLIADPGLIARAVRGGVLDSGGGVNHFTAHVVAQYLRAGRLDAHVDGLRAAYRARRDALIDALAVHLGPEWSWTVPGGGFFVWLRAPHGTDTTVLLRAAEAAGVSYAPGSLFHADANPAGGIHGDGTGRRHLRLAFSLLEPAEMEEGVRRLAAAWRDAM